MLYQLHNTPCLSVSPALGFHHSENLLRIDGIALRRESGTKARYSLAVRIA